MWNIEPIWNTLLSFWILIKWLILELSEPHQRFSYENIPSRPGDVAVVTGGSRGIGICAVEKLLIAEMHVIIGCRNIEDGKKVIDECRQKGIRTGKAECLHLDLVSLQSVREFAANILNRNVSVHALINNAGILTPPFKHTEDGYELLFQVNYLSHFLLTMLLLPRLASSASSKCVSRIVNVSSCALYWSEINFSQLQMKPSNTSEHHLRVYRRSKLMQVVMSNYLNAQLQAHGVEVRTYSLHPGIIDSNLYSERMEHFIFQSLLPYLFKSTEQGADGIIYAVLSSDIESEGGLMLANCKKIGHHPQAADPFVQQQLFHISCDFVGLKNTFIEDEFGKLQTKID